MASVTLSISGDTALRVGDTLRLQASARTAAGATVSGAPFTWTSTAPAVATVDGGLVHALSAGTTAIIATSAGHADTVTLTVTTASPPPGPTLVIVPDSAAVDEGDALQLVASIVDSGRSRPADSVAWSSSDGSIVYVSSYGRVYGWRPGVTTIVAARGPLRDSTQVAVREVPHRTFIASQGGTITIPLGDTLPVAPGVLGTVSRPVVGFVRLPLHPVGFTSSAPSVASIDADGRIVARSVGEARINTADGDPDFPLTVRVAPAPPDSMWRYEGCSPALGTCATVQVKLTRDDARNGWRAEGWIENRSYDAPNPADRSSLIAFVRWPDADLYYGYAEYDCAGCNDLPSGESRLSVIYGRFIGPYDGRCARDPACDAVRLPVASVDLGPAEAPYAAPGVIEVRYLAGRLWFSSFVQGSFTPTEPLQVTQVGVGGTAKSTGIAYDDYTLSRVGLPPAGLVASKAPVGSRADESPRSRRLREAAERLFVLSHPGH